MNLSPNGRVRLGAVLSLSLVGLLIVGGTSGASGATAAERQQIAIHEVGKNNINKQFGGIRGTFTIELKKARFGPPGTTVISHIPGPLRYVNGQQQISGGGTDHLTSKQGTIEIRYTVLHIGLNTKLTASDEVVGPAMEYGTWKIKAATGLYEGWRGGGNWASVAWGYANLQPYSTEWDGYITA